MDTYLCVTGQFKKAERIKRSTDIHRIFKDGKRVSVAGAKLFYLKNNMEFNRIAFVLPRGYGTAAERNSSKRYSRETFRFFKSHLNGGFDMLLLIYPGNDSFKSRCEQFKVLCRKAGLLRS